MSSKLPDSVMELMTNRVDSFEKLEMIVLLSELRTAVSIEEISQQLKAPRDMIREAALELRAASLVVITSIGDVQLLPPTSRDHAAVAELVRLYHEDRLAVVKTMGEIAVDRIRNMTSRVFADAFLFRKKPPKDGDHG